MSAARVLVVEDDRSAREYLELLLEQHGYTVRSATDGVEALVALEESAFDLVISDLRMPKLDGFELLMRAKQRWPALPLIVVSAATEVSAVVEAVQLGAVNFLVKPVAAAVMAAAVQKALRVRETPALPGQRVPELVGISRGIVEVRHLVALAARSDVNVMVFGETGTGKEVVTRAIHRTSNLGAGPFVAHNCARAPHELFESQFFGHRRGAFTGADRDHVGLLSRADEGVLVLDELETLSSMHQAQLLRVLDDGEVRPVGSEAAHRICVRFIAVTNHHPLTMLRQGDLREDLYYRLRGFEIATPPLRERPEDIPLLAAHFLESGAAGFTPDAMEALARAPWPGNVRQLRNAVRVAQVSAAGGEITRRHLSPAALGGAGSQAEVAVPEVAEAMTLRHLEQDAIARAMKQSGGNRSQAAQLLGIDRSTLRRKLRECEISERN